VKVFIPLSNGLFVVLQDLVPSWQYGPSDGKYKTEGDMKRNAQLRRDSRNRLKECTKNDRYEIGILRIEVDKESREIIISDILLF